MVEFIEIKLIRLPLKFRKVIFKQNNYFNFNLLKEDHNNHINIAETILDKAVLFITNLSNLMMQISCTKDWIKCLNNIY